MLDCYEPLDKVKAQGITFGKVACLTHCSGTDVQSFRANRVTIHDLRAAVPRLLPGGASHFPLVPK
jgi:glutathione gamma-glutamylcysteinyltransferase